MLAYEILCILSNRCTDRRNGIEQMGIPDALALLNIEDTRHLEHLAWAIYDGALLVGPWPKLYGPRPWCTMLAGLQRHIYGGHDDVAHCLPQTLGSWDHEEWVEALHCMDGLGRRRQASQPRRRSRSGSRQCSQMPACKRQLQTTSPHTPSRCPHGATLLPCATARCYCSATRPHDASTTLKVASVVNVPPHARSSDSGKGMALASLNQDEVLEDDFQTQHALVCHVKR